MSKLSNDPYNIRDDVVEYFIVGTWDDLMLMHCDNQTVFYIASNHVFLKRTNHIEVDCHFVHDAVARKLISTPSTPFF